MVVVTSNCCNDKTSKNDFDHFKDTFFLLSTDIKTSQTNKKYQCDLSWKVGSHMVSAVQNLCRTTLCLQCLVRVELYSVCNLKSVLYSVCSLKSVWYSICSLKFV